MSQHIVKFGKHPLFFYSNLVGKFYETCTEEKATKFPNPDEALAIARAHGMKLENITVQRIDAFVPPAATKI